MPSRTPAELGYYMPAEWQRHRATWLTWPKDPETWPNRVPQVEEIYLQMMAALAPHETVNLLVDDEETEQAVRARCRFPGADDILFHRIQTVDSWIRDYGPNFLLSDPKSDRLQFVDDSRKESIGEDNDKLKFIGQLVLEMSHSRKDHGEIMLVSGSDYLGIAHGTAGLDDRCDAVFGCFIEAVAKRKKSIGRQHRTRNRQLCAHGAELNGIHT